jgi:uncharacterized protein (TIGR02996 family)
MTTDSDFLRAFLESPEDDDLRLVFADWLDDHGDLRGELMRLQVLLGRRDGDENLRRQQEKRLRELLDHHAPVWVEPLRKRIEQCCFSRGMLHLWADATLLLKDLPHDRLTREACRWVEVLHLRGLGSQEVLAMAAFPHLTALDLSFATLNLPVGGDLLPSPLHGLSGLPSWQYLRSLNLERARVGEAGVRWLAHEADLPRLRSLNLRSNGIDAAGVAELAAMTGMPRLTSLNLANNSLDDAGLGHLISGSVFRGLEALNISYCGLSPAGISWAFGEHLTRVHPKSSLPLNVLNLAGNRLSPVGCSVLAHAPQLENLVALDLSDTHLQDDGLVALADAAHLPYLTSLQLNANGIGDAGLQVLARSPLLGRLTSLGLSRCPIHDAGVVALVESPLAVRLTRLELELCDLGNATANALARSPWMSNLTHLRIQRDRLSEEARSALRDRFGGTGILNFF